MKYKGRIVDLLTALRFKGVGRAKISTFWSKDISHREISVALGVSEDEFFEERELVESILLGYEDYCDGAVAFDHPDFPIQYCTRNIKKSDRPIVLFYKGDLSKLGKGSLPLAVIGLLNPSDNIEVAERMVVKSLVENGATIVSGLALGCDSIAHKQALDCLGGTVAILPSSLANILPTENAELARRIVESGGLLLTEYYTEPTSKYELISRYVERDRLQALFSQCVLLAASYAENQEGKDSGARHAMNKAEEYGIPRAVMYNDSKHRGNEMFDLNRQILSKGSTKESILYVVDSENYQDLIRNFEPARGLFD